MRYGEADLILHGLTSEGEKVHWIARSALKSKKRFAGGILEPTHYVHLSYKKKSSNSGLFALSEASLINDFKGAKENYDKIETALFMVSMIDQLTQEGEMDLQNLFHLLGNSLSAVEKTKSLPRLRALFEFKLMSYLGIRPQWGEVNLFLGKNISEHEEIDIEDSEALTLSHRAQRFIEENLNIRFR